MLKKRNDTRNAPVQLSGEPPRTLSFCQLTNLFFISKGFRLVFVIDIYIFHLKFKSLNILLFTYILFYVSKS